MNLELFLLNLFFRGKVVPILKLRVLCELHDCAYLSNLTLKGPRSNKIPETKSTSHVRS